MESGGCQVTSRNGLVMRKYFFVGLDPLKDWRRWPFAVKMDFGRFFVTILTVYSDQVAKKLFLVYFIHVILVGKKNA